MSSGLHLQQMESFFQHWDEKVSRPSLSTILELYNIKKFIDSGMRLLDWTDEQFSEYQDRCKNIPQILGRYFSAISDANLQGICQEVNWTYAADFWQLICDYKVYRRISPEVFKQLLETNENIVWYVLMHKGLAVAFGPVISEHLVHNSHTAEQLLAHFLAEHQRSKPLFFPDQFTSRMREQALWDYVGRDDANLNYLQLLEQSQSSKELPIPDRLKLQARRQKEDLQGKLFAGKPGFSYGVEVGFKSIPDGSAQEEYRQGDHISAYAYSREWLEENQDYPTLLNNFIYLFKYVDLCFRCTFLSLPADLGALERHLGVKGKDDYITGSHFNTKRMRTLLQMAAYRDELQRLHIQLEDIIQWFFEVYLKEEFGAEGFTYTPPSLGTTYIEKCKLLASATDGVLKQYRLFSEDGKVDRELLEMSSEHVFFRDIPSFIANKYAYANSAEIRREMDLLFSDQSILHYTEKTGSDYQTLPHMLQSVEMYQEDFAHYQKDAINWLIERGSVQIGDKGQLQINKARVVLLGDLYYHEVICPSYYNGSYLQQLESLVQTKEICYESTLFSRPEQDYLNYILNRSNFSNGLDLRNKYIHDTCPLDENMRTQDYMELLKIMILIIIKINEEFCLKGYHLPKSCTPQC